MTFTYCGIHQIKSVIRGFILKTKTSYTKKRFYTQLLNLRKGEHQNHDGFRLRVTQKNVVPYSFLFRIFSM